MKRDWIWWILLALAAGVDAGCNKGAGAIPPASLSCSTALPQSGAVTLCIPANGGVSGTLSFTVSGLPTGVMAQIEPSIAQTQPLNVHRKTAAASAVHTWSLTSAGEPSGTNAVIGGALISLTGLANPSGFVVEVIDANMSVSVFDYSSTTTTESSTTENFLPAAGATGSALPLSCLDQPSTCYIDIVAGSIDQPVPAPTVAGETPAAGPSCPVELPPSGAVTLCMPANGGVSGTLAFTVSGLSNGVIAQIEPSTAQTEPEKVHRKTASATSLHTWSFNTSDEANGTNAMVAGPVINLTGLTNPSQFLVEVLAPNGNVSAFNFNVTSGTGPAATESFLPADSHEATALLSSCLDQPETCFIDIVENSIFLPEPTPSEEPLP